MNSESSHYREFFGALANASRMAIIQLLRRRGATVTQIAEILGFEQSRVSHSLARLQRAHLVVWRWEEKRKMFYLADDVAAVLRDVDTFLTHRPAFKNGADRDYAMAVGG